MERKNGVDGVMEENQQGPGNWKHRSDEEGGGSDEAPVRRITVALAKAAEIRVDACRKHLARN